ncbi:MAG: amidohydrolase family protein [Pseudomonadota bacterium]
MTACAAQQQPAYDLIIRDGMLYDGSGGPPVRGDIAVNADRIVALGRDLGSARRVVDATDLAVAPGFINMLSWANESLLVDGLSQSDIRQGVTLEVMGEGWSMGPLNETMREALSSDQDALRFEIPWTTLGEYLNHLQIRGVSTNVASFVGAATVRIHEVGFADRRPTADELDRMRAHVRLAMEEGALGVGASLIYAPAFYADTAELIALCEVAAEYGGRYIAHLRSEGNNFLDAVNEHITIARDANIGAEIYHLKAAGAANYGKLDDAIARIEAARAEGMDVTANMYTYTAGATGLDASMPPWVQEGGYDAWAKRLKDPDTRARLRVEMTTPTDAWENLYLAAGDPSRVILVAFKSDALRPLTGKTLAQVSALRGTPPADTMMDLVIENGSDVGTVYFIMSEENVGKKLALPWMAFGSDGKSLAPEGNFLLENPHPCAYGNFARLLGKYVRDENALSLAEAIRRLTRFPADNLKLHNRGRLEAGYFADMVVFDPNTIQDHATFAEPHQYATGVQHVFVNGVAVLENGEHTGATPGRVVRGPGYKPAGN